MVSINVLHPGHAVALRMIDMNKTVKHYTEALDLWETARDKSGRRSLKARNEYDHHNMALHKADEAGMDSCQRVFCNYRAVSLYHLDRR